jgi:hypothetical protein
MVNVSNTEQVQQFAIETQGIQLYTKSFQMFACMCSAASNDN